MFALIFSGIKTDIVALSSSLFRCWMGRWVESQTDLKHVGIEIAVSESNKLMVIRIAIVWVESE